MGFWGGGKGGKGDVHVLVNHQPDVGALKGSIASTDEGLLGGFLGGVSCLKKKLLSRGGISPTRFCQRSARDGEDLAADDEFQTSRDLGFMTRRGLGDREAC